MCCGGWSASQASVTPGGAMAAVTGTQERHAAAGADVGDDLFHVVDGGGWLLSGRGSRVQNAFHSGWASA